MLFGSKRKILLIAMVAVATIGVFVFAGSVFAQNDLNFGLQPVAEGTGLGGQDIRITIAKIIRAVLGLLGIIALGVMLYGGFMYMTSGGDEEKVATGRKTLINGVIGLVIILSSLAIVQFVLNKLAEATGMLDTATSQACADEEYALLHPELCQPVEFNEFCTQYPDNQFCCKDDSVFYVKSITPVTDDTGMHNVAIRVLFNKSVKADDPAKVFGVAFGNQDISAKFDYEFLGDNFGGNQIGAQANYKAGNETCDDGTPCLNKGGYEVKVAENLQSQDGLTVTEKTACGDFPFDAEFKVPASGSQDYVMSFDGAGDRVVADHQSAGDITDEMTVSFWVYPVQNQNSSPLFKQIVDKGSTSAGYMLYLSKSDPAVPVFNKINTSVGFGQSNMPTGYTLPEMNKWYHVAMTLNKSKLVLFINGAQQKYINLGVNKVAQFTGPLVLGGEQTKTPNKAFKGKIDEFRLYNRVLSLEEIQAFASKKEGPYAGNIKENDGLLVGYHFDEGQGGVVKDYSASNDDATVDGAEWEIDEVAPVSKVKDAISPALSSIKINGSTEPDQALAPNKIYSMQTDISDSSGFGYLKFKTYKEIVGGGKAQVFGIYDGPTVKHGSDAPEDNPYQFIYPLLTAKNPSELTHYFLEVEAWDIDNNSAKTEMSYVLGEQKGTGDGCGEDWECESSSCVSGVCVAQPKVLDVYPLNGAAGNWITIVGNYFGDDAGQVAFARDDNGDGKIDESDEWHNAVVADCGSEDVWTNDWVIVSVPSDANLPLDSKSAIRLTRSDSTVDKPLLDYSHDTFGPKPGGDGLFTKNNVKRPGLCSVKTLGDGVDIPAGATIGPPGAGIVAMGDALGKGDNSGIFFGGVLDQKTKQLTLGIQASVDSGDWEDKKITTKVPNTVVNGKVAVYAKVGTESSNGVPFTIDSSGLTDKIPVIEQIDPASSTPGSLITISGKGFGTKPGEIYLASGVGEVKNCAKNNGGAGCVKLNTTLPGECGINWTQTQVIAQIPSDALIKNYQLILENEWEVASDGQEKFGVKTGAPAPGICKIQPDSGPAPLPAGKFLDIFGVNFKNPYKIYFWKNGAVVNNPTTWLSSDDFDDKADDEVNDEGTHILKVPIPVKSGVSMQSGPIKVGVSAQFSNGVKYTVENCQTAKKELSDAMKAGGYQCCTVEGPENGTWKSSNYVCGDEERIGGYVWRFTTGVIPILPQVMEECNEIDWNKMNENVPFPSPVPSVLWSKGKESCLNATIAFKFNVAMNEATLNKDTVEVFKCGGSDIAIDCEKKKEQITGDQFEFVYKQGDHTLEILRKPKTDQPDLDPFTWYQVELSDKVESNHSYDSGTGQKIVLNEKLQATKPCGVGTAYCFNFRTGNEMCTLKGAGIIPLTYTAHLLGLILDPAYPSNSVPIHPLYYFLWGKGSQECIVMQVDGLGWEWGVTPESEKWASVVKSPSFDYIDSRAEVTAKADTGADTAKITASIDQVAMVAEQSDFLDLVGKKSGLQIATTTDVITVQSLKLDDYILEDNYEIDIKYTLDDVSTSTFGFTLKKETKSGKQINVWIADRYILFKSLFSRVFVVEKQFEDGAKERSFVFYDGYSYVSYKQDYSAGKTGHYRVVKSGGKLVLTDMKAGVVVAEKKMMAELDPGDITTFQKAKLNLGGRPSTIPPGLLYGTIEKYLVKLMAGDNFNQSITATSTLKISLYDPEVVEWWPNCGEACVNSGIGFKFNVEMFKPDYDTKNFLLQECEDETCQTFVSGVLLNKTDNSTPYIARFAPQELLKPNTWYKVTVKAGVHAKGGYGLKLDDDSDDELGKTMKEDFVGKFKTKNDATPCAIANVDVFPGSFTASLIGQKQPYTVIAYGKPDQCAPFGQEFNPWGYGWNWSVKDTKVASITKFKSPAASITGCNLGCLLTGSNIKRDETPPPLCGNGEVEAGEDCDIGELDGAGDPTEDVDDSCTANCLRPGNKDAVTCGNSKVEPEKGEECDPKAADTVNCTKECVWTGAYEGVGSPVCGSGDVGPGEDCDIADPDSKFGCSDKCLHTGTSMAEGWCLQNSEKYKDNESVVKACADTTSVCGNQMLETGEECEQMQGFLSGKLALREDLNKNKKWEYGEQTIISVDKPKDYCSNSCLSVSLCSLKDKLTEAPVADVKNGGLRCDPKTEGCDPVNCHLTGSSVTYGTPSLCGDGIVGIGEYASCEASSEALQGKDENPVQLVTAIGKGAVDPLTKEQKTEVDAGAVSYLNQKGDFIKMSAVGGSGDYALKCGFKEFLPYLSNAAAYNDCPMQNDDSVSKWGVAANSCCYERSQRVEEYPADGAGLSAGAGNKLVCRNSYIAIKFNSQIDKDSLPGNLIIASGHDDDKYDCASTGEQDVTQLYKTALALNELEQPSGFWGKLWRWFKGLAAHFFGDDVLALKVWPSAKTWCSGSITAVPEITNETEISKEGLAVTTSTVSIYLNTLLPANSSVAVILKGGNDGIRDVNGVGVKSPDINQDALADLFVFKVGSDICKLKEVIVSPDKYLFTKPSTSATFLAEAHSTTGQSIVPIPLAYNWKWDWQPQTNVIFDIPAAGSSSSTPSTVIASKNMEGSLPAVANAEVIEDTSIEDNHVGKVFTGITWLEANFCENPWPPREFYPFEDGVAFSKDKNQSGFDASGKFDGTVLPDPQINYAMSYCADAGKSGEIKDDLPYLKPMLNMPWQEKMFDVPPVCQYSTKNVAGSAPIAQLSTEAGAQQTICSQDSDCPVFYNMPYANSTQVGGFSVDCNTGVFLETLMKKNCILYELKKGYCGKENLAAPQYGATYRSCTVATVAQDCQADEVCNDLALVSGFYKVDGNKCIAGEKSTQWEEAVFLEPDILKQFIFFNEKNDDVIGVKIFKNERRFSAAEWLEDKNITLVGAQAANIGGYDAMTDGSNFYINSLNISTTTGATYNNIYLLSINKNAQSDTKNVFDQLLKSLKFNINISDFGYCLKDSPELITKEPLPIGEYKPAEKWLATISSVKCNNNFDCRDSAGAPKIGTSGVCSNAKTKLFRDYSRLPDIKTALEHFEDYWKKNGGTYPDMKAGTYIPGYTASKWPSWGLLAGKVGGLPLEKINKWSDCPDNDAEGQTCWNPADSTFSCPFYASVYEYEMKDSGKDYKLHGPLEYFTVNSKIVQEKLDPDDGIAIDTSHFTTERACKPKQFLSPFAVKCGDGLINLGSEECEPPGKLEMSDNGVVVQAEKAGACAGGWKDFKKGEACFGNLDCGLKWKNYKSEEIYTEVGEGVCAVGDKIIFDFMKSSPPQLPLQNPPQLWGIACNVKTKNAIGNCKEAITAFPASRLSFDGKTVFVKGNMNSLLNNSALRCVLADGKTVDGLNDYFNTTMVDGHPTKTVSVSNCNDYEPSDEKFGACGDGKQAYSLCNNKCQLEYLSCKSKYECGNGIVEGKEKCDDGALNGTYGHCAGENSQPLGNACNGPHNQYCGNKEIDKSGNNNLEFCENIGNTYISYGTDTKRTRLRLDNLSNTEQKDKWLVWCEQGNQGACELSVGILASTIDSLLKQKDTFGYCQGDQTLACNSNDSCKAPSTAYKFDVSLPDSFINIDNHFSSILENKGPCVKPAYFGTPYHKNKALSCSWDCQNYGEYCGDGLVQSASGEDCDDKDSNNLNACNNFCLWVNTACKDKASFTTSTSAINETYVEIQKNPVGTAIPVNECFVNSNSGKASNGAEVCRAYGLYCKNVTFEAVKGSQVYGDFQDDYCVESFDGIKNTIYKNNPIRVECGGIYTGPAPAAPASTVGKNTCGNSIQETYTDNKGDKVVEKCDLGAQNGIACTPEYSKSCTYCAADCKEVLTKDSDEFCGNGKIDTKGSSNPAKWEGCEIINGKVVNYAGKEQVCNDQGQYTCSKDCVLSKPNESCVDCLKKKVESGGAVPKIAFLNPMLGEDQVWPSSPSVDSGVKNPFSVALYRHPASTTTPYLGSSKMSYASGTPGEMHNLFSKDNGGADNINGLESNLLCDDQYYLHFNSKAIYNYKYNPDVAASVAFGDVLDEVWLGAAFKDYKNFGDLFTYPVNGEKDEIKNEFIYSPAVPQNTFRVVVRWSDAEKNTDFMGSVYYAPFNLANISGGLNILGIGGSPFACKKITKDSDNYWKPLSCIPTEIQNNSAVWLHDWVNLEKTYAQAMTIKALGTTSKHPPFAFFVEAVGEYISEYTSSPDVQVEVYTYHNGQISDLSVYKPTSVFKINEALKSTSASAQYWHVFNLEYKNGKYEIVPVQKIKTGWCELQQDIPDEKCVLVD